MQVEPSGALGAEGSDTVAATLDIFLDTPRLNAWIFDRLEPWCGQRVAEVGAGIGTITSLLLDREHVLATDVDDDFVRKLSVKFASRPNVVCERLDLENVPVDRLRSHRLDTVLCVNVLEHVKDDAGALARIADALPTGGRVLLYVPALPWLYGSIDKGLLHHRRYGKTELLDKLESAGFTVLHASFMNLLGIPGWFVNSRVLKRRLLPVKQVRLYDRLTGVLRVEDRFRLPIGMSLVAVGEKR